MDYDTAFFEKLKEAVGDAELTESEADTLRWIAGWDKRTVDNIASIIRKARSSAMQMNDETIYSLINSAVLALGHEEIYHKSLRFIDLDAMEKANPALTNSEIITNFTVGGFCNGIDFALRNLEIRDDGEDTQ